MRWRPAYGTEAAFAAAFLALCVASLGFVFVLGQDLFPQVDAGLMRLHVRARTGLRIEETARLTDEIENDIRTMIPRARTGHHARQHRPAL